MKNSLIDRFLSSMAFAVVGVSGNRDKFGNKVLRCYMQHGKTVHPVNPREHEIEGLACIPSITALPDTVFSISLVTPPVSAPGIVREAVARGIRHIWMQPGAESAEAIEIARKAGLRVIADGSCILRHLGFTDI